MKKVLLSIVGALSFTFASAQLQNYSVGQTAPDFTVTDVHGGTHTLYDITSGGQYVLIDFFFVTCGPCQATAPTVTSFYQKYGCNEGDVYVISIDNGYSTNDVLGFESQFAGPNSNPAVSGNDGGGNAVNSTYGPQAYPTVVLIGPDNKFISTDIWPIGSIADLENAFPSGALTEMSCATGIADNGFQTEVTGVYPNPAVETANVEFSLGQASEVSFEIVDMLGKKVEVIAATTYDAGANTVTIPVTELPAGNYFVNLVADNEIMDVTKLVVIK